MQWKLSFLIGAPVVVLTLIVAAVIVVAIWRTKWYRDDKFIFSAVAVGAALFIVVPTFIGTLFPLSPEYLQYRPVEGTVQQVDKRMVRDGEGMSERYVVQIDGQAYGIDDTRAASITAGDDVSLMCTKEWQWASTHGYGCRWNM